MQKMIEEAGQKEAQFFSVACELLEAIGKKRQNLSETVKSIEEMVPPLSGWEGVWYHALSRAAGRDNPELENWALTKAWDSGLRDPEFLIRWQGALLAMGNVAEADGMNLKIADSFADSLDWGNASDYLIRALQASCGPNISAPLLARKKTASDCLSWLEKLPGREKWHSLRKSLRKHVGYLTGGNTAAPDFNLILIDLSSDEFTAPEGRARSLEAFKTLLEAPTPGLKETLCGSPDLRILWKSRDHAWLFTSSETRPLTDADGILGIASLCAHLEFNGKLGNFADTVTSALPGSESRSVLSSREGYALHNLPIMGAVLAQAYGIEGYGRSGAQAVLNQLAEGGERYAESGSNTEPVYGAFVSFYCATSGLANDFMGFLLKLYNPPYSLPSCDGLLGRFTRNDIDGITRALKKDGYFVFPNRLPDNMVDALVKYASTSPRCYAHGDNGKARETCIYPATHPLAQQYDFLERDLLHVPEVQSLIADPTLFAVSQAYLGAKPIMDAVSMWWSTTFSRVASAEAAQLYHFDLDRIQWLKWFVYLTDVDTDTGPHCFVKGSHKTGAKPTELLQHGYQRIADADIERFYPKENLIEFTGRKGTVFVEDTSGFHKGKHPTKGPRLLLELEFANSLFGTVFARDIRVGDTARPYLLEASRTFPGLLGKYAVP